MSTLMPDGLVQLNWSELCALSFQHLISGMDDCRSPTTGYTEWLSTSSPVLTLGWDWQLENIEGRPALKRVGSPRSNIHLQNMLMQNIDESVTLARLSHLVDTLNWQCEVMLQLGFASSKNFH